MTATFLLVLLPFIVCVLSLLAQKSELFSAGPGRSRELEEKINELLPQTQCGKCDYDGCRPYARAIASRQADFNHCPPGGDETIARIAALLGEDTKPLKSAYPQASQAEVAVIDETLCIGCVLCIRACPVDAIIGAAKQMHAVIESACTGCELCIPPCPVDCITMVPCR